MVALTLFALAASFAGLAAADLQVTNPSANSWWVAQSQNVLAWTCGDTTHSTFTVLISNSNPTVLVAPLAIISIQQNADCSKLITQQQSAQPAGTGYRVLLANPLNNTEVYAQSDEFEIKPLGSAYPSTSPVAGPSSTSSASGGASPSQTPNGAASVKSLGLGLSVGVAAVIAYLV